MKKALLVIDVQMAFEDKKWGTRNNPDAEENIARILEYFRSEGDTVIHIQHVSSHPDSRFYIEKEGVEFKEIVTPLAHESVIQKTVNSAFIGTNLENRLKEMNIEHVVIVGLTTPHCVSTTTRMSGNLGFHTTLIADATAAFELTDYRGITYGADLVHNLTLATLHEEFARVIRTEDWLREQGE
ncbi:cysteine hydrolase family protein [Alkalicoccobacillus gibsonii]|uniref:Cysteine hydrolase family protein n=1 Tax=Alkalicoccobacillus gibsonii TaxID=79881 RepID=A0ABU9VEU3_9BACI